MKLCEATASEEILEVLARRCWHLDHDRAECPLDKLVTVQSVAEQLTETPESVGDWQHDLNRGLNETMQLVRERGSETLQPPRRWWWTWVETSLQDPRPKLIAVGVGPRLDTETVRERRLDEAQEWSEYPPLLLSVEEVHTAWCGLPEPRPPHPLEALVRAWQKRPRRVDLHQRVDPILPTIRVSEAVARTRGRIFGGLVPQDHEPTLPLFPEAAEAAASILADVPLLALSDATGAPVTARGRGAELSLATLVRGMTLVGLDDREYGIVEIAPSVRDMRDALWPNGWERRHDWPRLRQALRESRDRFIPLPGGAEWWPMVATYLPGSDAHLDETMILAVTVPPGAAAGTPIDTRRLAQLRPHSGGAYRAYIAVHSLAWQPGVTRVPTRDGPTVWTGEATRYPILTRQDRRDIVFGVGDTSNRTHAQVDEPFEVLVEAGDVYIPDRNAFDPKRHVRGWRVIPKVATSAVKAWLAKQEGGNRRNRGR
ncbi:MAG: hypothetical protein OXH85_05050 [Truepera sp.]|nr:hypothetical protein [Truepera sp.]